MNPIISLLQDPYIVLAVVAWDLIWRGLALWKAARNSEKYWYLALLLANTVGILPIIYLLYKKYFAKSSK